ncbi:AfsR/SARP family transcriptional regulator [Streptomyces agglomeratus]|uniref:SARP family transcriptional regulator n=1 Tax=Streptomyces agglomeratus TaxID=285458 RepID=A0A1E5PGA1_9ACTN|nr:BTAD domain-containing putative transcriptional regulator [Streptomyces agglomeratus]OEJ28552.1 SARP family transcriptional regulator [Streptomyces agglomeratus]
MVFRILGPLHVHGPHGQVRIPPGRQEVILAALLLEANRVVSTDYLVDLIWEDEPPDTARTQVQICVSRLRKLFGKETVSAAITTRPPGYVLRTEDGSVDAALFSRRIADARLLRKQPGGAAEAVELLRAADGLWQGDCLSGLSSETLRSKARQLDEERLTAAETRIDLELELGRHHQLVGEIQLLVHEHPLRERLRGRLMLALYRSGRQVEALDVYRVGRHLLVEELGLEPGGELRQLESAILAGNVPPPRLGEPGAGDRPPPAATSGAGVAAGAAGSEPRHRAPGAAGGADAAGRVLAGSASSAPEGPGAAFGSGSGESHGAATGGELAATGGEFGAGSGGGPAGAGGESGTRAGAQAGRGGPVTAPVRDTAEGAGADDPRPGRPAGLPEPGGRAAGGGPAGAHAPALPAEVPRQLPADTADFVGHETRISVIEKTLLGTGERRAVGLVVIVGKPGTGKSTLATHIAHRAGERHFTDGQLYCDLRGTSGAPATAGEVLGRFLRALGIPGPVIPDSLDERAEMYRTLLGSRRVLVVLDDAASESQVRPLLPGAGSCAVLVTSRVRMTGLPGAHRVELDVLGTEEAMELLVRVIGEERVAGERVSAQALIRTVGGLPLALRIIAARLAARPHWTLASMVHRLANERHRLDELTHGEMTMRASLSLTHDGLCPGDQRLLRLLSLARGPSLPGWLAGALLDDRRPFPSDLLEPLVDVQMLDVVGMESTGGFRYRFHEIIRVFAREQLAAHDDPATQSAALRRMMGGWMALAEVAHRRIYGGDFTVLHGTAPRWLPPAAHVDELLADPLEWLDSEHANLVQAVEHAAAEQLDEVCWDLTTTLVTLFETRGYLDHWERTHQVALGAARSAGNKRGSAAVLASLGSLYLSRSQHEEARAALSTALGLFTEIEDRQGLALCHRDLALLERFRGNEHQALELYDRALRDFDLAGDVVGRAIVLTQSAQIWMLRGQSAAAQSRLDEALGIYRSVRYTGGQARTLRRAGQLQQRQGEMTRAVATFTEVLELCRDSGDVIGEGHLLRDLGLAHAGMGHVAAARECLDRALSIREQIMDQGGASMVRLDLARLLTSDNGPGDRDRSQELLHSAVQAFRDRRMAPELAEAQQLLAGG